MVAGGGSTTLPVYIYSMVKMGVSPEVNAVSSLMLIFSIIIVTLYWLLNRKISK
jgi:spermidine/putrescine transport system permease protein